MAEKPLLFTVPTRGRFGQLKQALLKQPVADTYYPALPICEVNQRQLKLHNWSWYHSLRPFTLVGLAIWCLHFYISYSNLVDQWKIEEQRSIDAYYATLAVYGDDYFNQHPSKIPDYRWDFYQQLKIIAVDEIPYLPFSRYLKDMHKASLGDIIFITINALYSSLVFLYLLTPRQPLPIIFDRQRQLVYTYFRGNLCAAHYDQMYYAIERNDKKVGGCAFVLYYQDHRLNGQWRHLPVVPQVGQLIVDIGVESEYWLLAIAHYMENGREAIHPCDWKGRRPLSFLFKRRFPKNLEAKLDAIEQELLHAELPDPYVKEAC